MNVSDLGFGVAGALDHAVLRVVARRLEAEGFRTLWVNDTPDGDALAGLAVAAAETSRIRLATGVISIDRSTPEAILEAVRQHELPEHRLILGIGGAAKPRPLSRVEQALAVMKSALDCRIMVGALGPKMRRLGAERGDGLLLNWLTPEAAREAVADRDRDAAHAGTTGIEACLYVRTALGAAAGERMREEAERYGRIPSYKANFDRMGVSAGDTTVAGETAAEIREGLDRYTGMLDELVVRAVTPADTADEYLRLIDAIVD